MKYLINRFLLIGVLLVVTQTTQIASAQPLKIGSQAPDFTLKDQDNKAQTLSKIRGKWVVMYFYPKDETPGCTTEACNFRDNILSLRVKNAAVWGISVDDGESHAKFSKKYKLPFTLLSDPKGRVARQYGSLLNMLVFKVAKRHSFIIDPQGRIAKIYRSVNPKLHVAEVLKDLDVLQGKASSVK